MIYFDNNATTRTFDCVVDAMRPFFTELYVNPSSSIANFNGLSQKIQRERLLISAALGIENTEQLIVTSGATESNNLALLGAARANPDRRHLVITAIEHPSVIEVADVLRMDRYRVSVLPARTDGTIDLDALYECLSPDTLLVSAMFANNETGVIQPLKALTDIVKRYDEKILVHTDATQAVGKTAIDLSADLSCIDMMSFSAHKFHGPKGTGGLFVRDCSAILPILHGGAQQKGMRSGTENPAGLVGMSTALASVLAIPNYPAKVSNLRDQLETGILTTYQGAFALGATAQRLPTTSNICLPNLDADEVVDNFAMRGIAISAGSACSHGARRPSQVAAALGLSYQQAMSCIRISLSIETTSAEVSTFLAMFSEITSSLVERSGNSGGAN